MKTINLLAGSNTVGSSLMGVIDFIQFANAFWRNQSPNSAEPLLDYRIYAWKGERIEFSNGLSVDALPVDSYVPADAVFLIPAFAHGQQLLNNYLHNTQAFQTILQNAVNSGALVVSYCTGTFGLAASGVLNHRQATTVWRLNNQFQSMFPDIELNLDELVVQDDNIITGGATTSYFNVCLRVLELLTDNIFAMKLSKLMLMDRHRLSQRAFMDSGLLVNKRDDMVEQVQNWMMQHFNQPISLERVCNQFNVTKRTLIRRFKASCNDTPLNYLQTVRVEKAKHYLETTTLPVEQIVERVGYEDTTSFRKLFVSQTQLTPKAYRSRFSMIAQQA